MKRKVNPWADEKPYPEPVKRRGGCKVSWLYYNTKEEAEVCSTAARHNAKIAEGQGYDFGYCDPGSINPPGEQNFNPELFEVCIP